VEIPTTSLPKVYKAENGDIPPFRVGYDPNSQSLFVNLFTPELQFQTWGFNGKKWTYVSECLSSYSNSGDIIFNKKNNTLYDLIFTYALPYWTPETIVGKWDIDHWIEENPLEGLILDATYDEKKQKIVILNLSGDSFNYLVFYDESSTDRVQIPWQNISDPNLIEYDPIHYVHLIIAPSSNFGLTWEYQNGNFVDPGVTFPYDPNECFGEVVSIAYSPFLEGIITFTVYGCTLLWKDQSWTILMKMTEDLLIRQAFDGKIVYFPPTQDILLFSPHPTTQEMMVFRLRERAHNRPFRR